MIHMLRMLAIVDALVIAAGFWGAARVFAGPAHALITVVALGLSLQAMRRGEQPHAVVMTIASALGPLAMVGAAMASGMMKRLAGDGAPPDIASAADMAEIAPVPNFGRRLTDRLEDRQINTPTSAQLASLHRYLRHGNHTQRQSAISASVRCFDVRLTPVILRALGDQDQAVRAQAAAAATEISRKLAHDRALLQEEGDALGLSALLAAHARGNVLLSEAMRDQFHTSAITLMRGQEPLEPEDRLTLAGLLLDHGQAAGLVAELLPLLESGGGGGEADSGALLTIVLEALSRQRDFATLQKLAHRYGHLLPPGSLFRPARLVAEPLAA